MPFQGARSSAEWTRTNFIQSVESCLPMIHKITSLDQVFESNLYAKESFTSRNASNKAESFDGNEPWLVI